MKKLLSILFVLACISVNAQAVANNKTLTKSELETAKGLYSKMVSSDIYVLMNKKIRVISEKLNGLQEPLPKNLKELKSEADIENIYNDWLSKNLQKTKYKSVDEGVTELMASFKMLQKVLTENKELYKLMSKASREQNLEIVSSENIYDRYYNLKN